MHDTGIGIPADQQARIFEKFMQVDGSLGRRHGGTGLGLAITRELVLRMGGELALRSTLGEGTTFRVRLPTMTTMSAAAPRPDAVGASTAAKDG